VPAQLVSESTPNGTPRIERPGNCSTNHIRELYKVVCVGRFHPDLTDQAVSVSVSHLLLQMFFELYLKRSIAMFVDNDFRAVEQRARILADDRDGKLIKTLSRSKRLRLCVQLFFVDNECVVRESLGSNAAKERFPHLI
jgi:hypothetical protein